MLVVTSTTADENGLPDVIPSGARDLGKRGVTPTQDPSPLRLARHDLFGAMTGRRKGPSRLSLVGAVSMHVNRELVGVMALVLLVTVMAGLLAGPVHAQESGTNQSGASESGTTEVQVRAGPYDITVVSSLSNLSLGQARFFITVLDVATGEPVRDARVVVRLKGSLNDTQGWANALYVPSPPEHYEARIVLDAPGTWRVAVEVTSDLGTEEVVASTLEVPISRTYTSGSIVFAGVFVVLLLGACYVWWSVRRAQRQRLEVGAASEGESSNAGLDT